MLIHGTAVARGDDALLLLGPSGSGKSALALELLDRGFTLVADDGLVLEDDRVRVPDRLAGLIEVRGLGLLAVPFRRSARAVLVLALGQPVERLPATTDRLGVVPLLPFDVRGPAAPLRAVLAFDCARGRRHLRVGPFGPSADTL